MATASSCIVALAVSLAYLGTIQSLREARTVNAETKYIAGIPVHNYQYAHTNGLDAASEESEEVVWVVGMDPETSDDTIHGLCMLAKCMDEGHPDEGGVPWFAVLATDQELEHLLETANEAAPDVIKFVEPDFEVSADTEVMEDHVVDVDMQRSLWGLSRIGVSSRRGTGRGAHVYVIDTGVRVTHKDFGGRAIPGFDNIDGKKQVCSSNSKSCSIDRQGHGTHCAGTAVGTKYGVASGARVYGVKVLPDKGSGRGSWTTGGLDWVSRSGKRPAVASMSLGGQGQSSQSKSAVDAAVRAGVVVVVSAGNKKSDACGQSPAFVPNAITVGSTDSRDSMSGFSNYGKCVKIWAPGTRILSAGVAGDTAQKNLSGTSMACPHVSGGAALLLAANPKLNSKSVLRELKSKAFKNVIKGLRSSDTNMLLHVKGFGR